MMEEMLMLMLRVSAIMKLVKLLKEWRLREVERVVDDILCAFWSFVSIGRKRVPPIHSSDWRLDRTVHGQWA